MTFGREVMDRVTKKVGAAPTCPICQAAFDALEGRVHLSEALLWQNRKLDVAPLQCTKCASLPCSASRCWEFLPSSARLVDADRADPPPPGQAFAFLRFQAEGPCFDACFRGRASGHSRLSRDRRRSASSSASIATISHLPCSAASLLHHRWTAPLQLPLAPWFRALAIPSRIRPKGTHDPTLSCARAP